MIGCRFELPVDGWDRWQSGAAIQTQKVPVQIFCQARYCVQAFFYILLLCFLSELKELSWLFYFGPQLIPCLIIHLYNLQVHFFYQYSALFFPKDFFLFL